jgi:putative hydrolase of HD superfamily
LIINFFKTSANLKKIPRQGWIDKLSISKSESVADHTFSMAIMGMIFGDLENYNTEKILKMILLHDLAESITGDIVPEKISRVKKAALENNTIKKIFSDLPASLQKQYSMLWEEYQANNSKEAKIVHQIDKLEMALQARIYFNDGYSQEKLESFFKSAQNEITDPKISQLLGKILEK